jgi:hypothetical protein
MSSEKSDGRTENLGFSILFLLAYVVADSVVCRDAAVVQ